MKLRLGIKSDPVEYRYTYEWLFGLMQTLEIEYLQLGSFFELYQLPDDYFHELRELAGKYGVRIKSCFTAHRELGGFFTRNRYFEAVARKNYERFIEIGAILGADFVGSNPGAVYRDRFETKREGMACYAGHMVELSRRAYERSLRGLTMEPMSSMFEPPTAPEEIASLVRDCRAGDPANRVPVYVCGDISHGLIDAEGTPVFDHEKLFRAAIPWMAEFHFKNTDRLYGSTFGFEASNRERGIIDLERIHRIIDESRDLWPVDEVVGYLEIGGPKLGRDYSDPLLESMLVDSIHAIREVFGSL